MASLSSESMGNTWYSKQLGLQPSGMLMYQMMTTDTWFYLTESSPLTELLAKVSELIAAFLLPTLIMPISHFAMAPLLQFHVM